MWLARDFIFKKRRGEGVFLKSLDRYSSLYYQWIGNFEKGLRRSSVYIINRYFKSRHSMRVSEQKSITFQKWLTTIYWVSFDGKYKQKQCHTSVTFNGPERLTAIRNEQGYEEPTPGEAKYRNLIHGPHRDPATTWPFSETLCVQDTQKNTQLKPGLGYWGHLGNLASLGTSIPSA